MKISQFKKIIQEETKSVLRENAKDAERVKQSLKKSPWSGKVQLTWDGPEITTIPPGVYDIQDGDMEGRRFSTAVTIKVTKPIDTRELMIQMAQVEDYVSPWGRIDSIEKAKNPKNYTSTYPTPAAKSITSDSSAEITGHFDTIASEIKSLIPLTAGRPKSNAYKNILLKVLDSVLRLKKELQ